MQVNSFAMAKTRFFSKTLKTQARFSPRRDVYIFNSYAHSQCYPIVLNINKRALINRNRCSPQCTQPNVIHICEAKSVIECQTVRHSALDEQRQDRCLYSGILWLCHTGERFLEGKGDGVSPRARDNLDFWDLEMQEMQQIRSRFEFRIFCCFILKIYLGTLSPPGMFEDDFPNFLFGAWRVIF